MFFLSFQWEKHPYYNLTVKVLRARNIKGTDLCEYLVKVLRKQILCSAVICNTGIIVMGSFYLHSVLPWHLHKGFYCKALAIFERLNLRPR